MINLEPKVDLVKPTNEDFIRLHAYHISLNPSSTFEEFIRCALVSRCLDRVHPYRIHGIDDAFFERVVKAAEDYDVFGYMLSDHWVVHCDEKTTRLKPGIPEEYDLRYMAYKLLLRIHSDFNSTYVKRVVKKEDFENALA